MQSQLPYDLPQGYKVSWAPQASQLPFVTCPVKEILFGGSRGGGKTDASLGRFLIQAMHYGSIGKGSGVKGLFLRHTYPQLEAVIARSKEILPKHNWVFNESKTSWKGPQNQSLKFRPLETDDDAANHQGADYTSIMAEEVTNWADPKPLFKLKGTLRSATGIHTSFTCTANPGGKGHQWVKSRYIDPAPDGWKVIQEVDPHSGQIMERIYIPSRLTDNKILMENDPTYIATLSQTGSEAQVKAWLFGLWDSIEGQYFDEWDSRKHVCKPFHVPDHWTRFRGADWGSYHPFAVLWFAVASEHYRLPNGYILPKGGLIGYREWYGISHDRTGSIRPNVGIKLPAEQVGLGIASLEKDDARISYGVLDPSAFASSGGPSYAERIARASKFRVMFRPADNSRTAKEGRLGGWDQVRSRLRGEKLDPAQNEEQPMLVFFNTCVHTIRTVPFLQHDDGKPEDLDTQGEDHCADALRYACMSRPYHNKSRVEQFGPLNENVMNVSLDVLWNEIASGRSRSPARV